MTSDKCPSCGGPLNHPQDSSACKRIGMQRGKILTRQDLVNECESIFCCECIGDHNIKHLEKILAHDALLRERLREALEKWANCAEYKYTERELLSVSKRIAAIREELGDE